MPAVLVQSQILDVARRVTPPSYHVPLEGNPNSGWEIHQAHAVQLARGSTGLGRIFVDAQILLASGPAHSQGEVSFSRPTAGAGAVTLSAGTTVLTADGRAYQTQEDAVFGPLDVGPVTVAVRSAGYSYAYNCRAGAINIVGRLGDGSTEPDSSIEVTNVSELGGGRPPALDALGHDRGVERARGESDDVYRARIRTVAETVTPAAIATFLLRWGSLFGVALRLTEAPDPALWCDSDFCDDPGDEAGSISDRAMQRGAFTVWLPDIGPQSDTASYCDTDYCDTSCADGGDAAKSSVSSGLLVALDRMKAGGIAIRVIDQGAMAGYPVVRDNYTDDIEAP